MNATTFTCLYSSFTSSFLHWENVKANNLPQHMQRSVTGVLFRVVIFFHFFKLLRKPKARGYLGEVEHLSRNLGTLVSI